MFGKDPFTRRPLFLILNTGRAQRTYLRKAPWGIPLNVPSKCHAFTSDLPQIQALLHALCQSDLCTLPTVSGTRSSK